MSVFESYFAEETKGLLKWKDPIRLGFNVLDYVEDKSGSWYFKVEVHYPDGEIDIMNTYPFSSMVTQLTTLYGGLEESIGKKFIVKYKGKEIHPEDKTRSFHSCYIEDLTKK